MLMMFLLLNSVLQMLSVFSQTLVHYLISSENEYVNNNIDFTRERIL